MEIEDLVRDAVFSCKHVISLTHIDVAAVEKIISERTQQIRQVIEKKQQEKALYCPMCGQNGVIFVKLEDRLPVSTRE